MAVVGITFVLVVQLAFTGIGLEIGPHWSEPAELDTAAGPTGELVDVVATADGDAPGSTAATSDGRIAWVVAEAGQYRVRVATVSSQDGSLDVGDPQTIASSDTELESVAIAQRNGTTAVVWKRSDADQVALAVDDGAGTSEPRTVSTNDSIRVNNPSVALVDGTPIVAYQEYAQTTGSWRGVLATVSANGSSSRFGQGIGPESVSPAVSAGPNGAVVAWVDTDEALAKTAPVSLNGSGDGGYVVGEAIVVDDSRTLRSMSGTGRLAEVQVAASREGAVLLWTDLGNVRAVRLDDGGAAVDEPAALGSGQNPGLGAGDERWLATTLVSHRSSGIDVRYSLEGRDDFETGPLSRLPSTAVKADATFAPDPVVAWTESSNEKRLLVSAYRAEAQSGPLQRLGANPTRFVFLGLSALAIGAVTVAASRDRSFLSIPRNESPPDDRFRLCASFWSSVTTCRLNRRSRWTVSPAVLVASMCCVAVSTPRCSLSRHPQAVRVHLVLADEYTVRFDGASLCRLNPDERSTAALIRMALEQREEAIGHQPVETSPGVSLYRMGFEDALSAASRGSTVVQLHENGEPLVEAEPPEEPLFVLSDHHDFSDTERECLDDAVDRRVHIDPKRLHAHHTITVNHTESIYTCFVAYRVGRSRSIVETTHYR